MKSTFSPVTNWLVGALALLTLLWVARGFLVPLVFAILLWNVLNALIEALERYRLPNWLAWVVSMVMIAAAIYLIVAIVTSEASVVAAQGPLYIQRLEGLAAKWFEYLKLGSAANIIDYVSTFDYTTMLGRAATSFGNLLFEFSLVLVYVGFLIAEQKHLPGKLAKLAEAAGTGSDMGARLFRQIADQIQTYLGVVTLLSSIMGIISYALLKALGIDFAGFWALLMFLLTYIPVVGAVGVILPALMALAQTGEIAPALFVGVTLFSTHFVLTNIVAAIMMGRQLNLSPLAIIVSLTFWGLVWGIAGLFLAVPLTAALAIVFKNVAGLQWAEALLAGPDIARAPSRQAKKTVGKTAE